MITYIIIFESNTNVGEIITLNEPPDDIIVKVENKYDIDSNLIIDNDSSLIPIAREDCRFSVKYKFWISDKKLSEKPVQFLAEDKSGVQMSFAYTFHKAVGQTIPKLIPCLSKRPKSLCQLTYRSLLVALSRVEEGKNMRLLFDPRDDLSYLTKLKPPKDYFIWLKGFVDSNDNKWNEDTSVMEWINKEKEMNSAKESQTYLRTIKLNKTNRKRKLNPNDSTINPQCFNFQASSKISIPKENSNEIKNDDIKTNFKLKSFKVQPNILATYKSSVKNNENNDNSTLKSNHNEIKTNITDEDYSKSSNDYKQILKVRKVDKMDDFFNSKYIDNKEITTKSYELPTLQHITNLDNIKIIFWYKFDVGSCFYDSVLFCLKRSKWKNIVESYNNGLELRIDSLNWIIGLSKIKPTLYDEFYSFYLELINVIESDISGGTDGSDACIIGCNTIVEHATKMLSDSQEYCRNIDVVILSTFLSIDIHIFTKKTVIFPRK